MQILSGLGTEVVTPSTHSTSGSCSTLRVSGFALRVGVYYSGFRVRFPRLFRGFRFRVRTRMRDQGFSFRIEDYNLRMVTARARRRRSEKLTKPGRFFTMGLTLPVQRNARNSQLL